MNLTIIATACLTLILVSSCASVPRESVDMSREIGTGLKKQYEAEIDLVDMQFSYKRKRLDDALQQSMKTYFDALTPSDSITLTRSQINDIGHYVLTLNMRYTREEEKLDQLRLLLIRKLHDNYLTLDHANASITALLQSAVDVKQARREAYQQLAGSVNQGVNLDNILSRVDEITSAAGNKSVLINDLIDSLRH